MKAGAWFTELNSVTIPKQNCIIIKVQTTFALVIKICIKKLWWSPLVGNYNNKFFSFQSTLPWFQCGNCWSYIDDEINENVSMFLKGWNFHHMKHTQMVGWVKISHHPQTHKTMKQHGPKAVLFYKRYIRFSVEGSLWDDGMSQSYYTKFPTPLMDDSSQKKKGSHQFSLDRRVGWILRSRFINEENVQCETTQGNFGTPMKDRRNAKQLIEDYDVSPSILSEMREPRG